MQGGLIDDYRFGALGGVAAGYRKGDGLVVGHHVVDYALGVFAEGVLLDGAEVVGQGVACGFAGLGHEVGDVHARGFGMDDGGGDFGDQEIGEDAGVEGARAEEDEVGGADGFDGWG